MVHDYGMVQAKNFLHASTRGTSLPRSEICVSRYALLQHPYFFARHSLLCAVILYRSVSQLLLTNSKLYLPCCCASCGMRKSADFSSLPLMTGSPEHTDTRCTMHSNMYAPSLQTHSIFGTLLYRSTLGHSSMYHITVTCDM